MADGSSEETAPREIPLNTEQLRDLLRAQSAVAAELELHAVLRRVVLAARELVDARYAALGVVGKNGLFDEFVYAGMDPGTVERLGQLPEGLGILGLPADHAAPVRLGDLRAHPASAGFPPHHPIMDGFLGVPIRIRDRAFGTLYLTESAKGEFSAEDEQLVVLLAGAAAVAIDNARLHGESARRDRWSTVSADVTRQLLAGQNDHPLDLVLRSARDTASADFATLAFLVEPGRLRVKAAVGALAEHLVGATMDARAGLAGQVTRTRIPVLAAGGVDAVGDVLPARVGSVIIVPLTAGGTVMGTLNVGRVVGAPAFADADTGYLAGFAGQAGMAMELDHTRADRSARVTADEDRIGADLNDHVIKELFAVTLSLQGLLSITEKPADRTRLIGCIGRLDAAVKRIRAAIFNVTITEHQRDELHHRLLTILDVHAPALGHPVGIRFTRLSDQPLPPDLADDILSVVRDTMTDIARQDGTSRVHLRIDITDHLVLVEITSRGPDVESPPRAELLTALRRSARAHTGTLRYFTPAKGASHLVWTAHKSNGTGRTDDAT